MTRPCTACRLVTSSRLSLSAAVVAAEEERVAMAVMLELEEKVISAAEEAEEAAAMAEAVAEELQNHRPPLEILAAAVRVGTSRRCL